jgi:hypothetical protein
MQQTTDADPAIGSHAIIHLCVHGHLSGSTPRGSLCAPSDRVLCGRPVATRGVLFDYERAGHDGGVRIAPEELLARWHPALRVSSWMSVLPPGRRSGDTSWRRDRVASVLAGAAKVPAGDLESGNAAYPGDGLMEGGLAADELDAVEGI